MKDAVILQKRDRTPLVTKIILLLIFLLGAAIIVMGYTGIREYGTSGVSSEAAYRAIYKLHGDTETAWSQKIEPQMAALSEQDRASVDEVAYGLLTAAWEGQKKGSTAELEKVLEENERNREELVHKLLYATYLVNGPKVSTSNKKALAAIPAEEMDEFRLKLLQAAIDENAPLPA